MVLGALAFRSIVDREARARQGMTDELQERLTEAVAAYEARLLRELDAMVADASAPGADLAALERRWQRTRPWVDALYTWRVIDAPAATDIVFDHPRVPPPEPPVDLSCATAAREAVLEPDLLPDALLAACLDVSPAARLYASTEAAQLHREAGRPHAALDALDEGGVDDVAPLSAYPAVPVARRVTRRLLRADLLDETGDATSGRRLREATVLEIAALPAPDLEGTLFLVPALVDRLADDAGAARLRTLAARAEQRLAAWRELGQNVVRRPGTSASEAARFTFDQYSDAPYLLYVRRGDTGGVALQLRQDVLLESFLSGVGFLQQVVVTDLTGRAIAGRTEETPSSIIVPFSASLTHLNASLSKRFVDARLGSAGPGDTVPLAAIVALCLALGFAGLWAQQRANRRQQQLLERQRSFTARVTHELKTPLAGIKVMAESLGLGSFRDAHQREQMADRIVQEVDRLTDRINEVLHAAKRRELPEPELVDLEEIVFELLDTWGPRYEQAEIELHADLAPTAPLLGDPIALRDAIACLLDNALKYRREDVASRVGLEVRQEGRWIELAVTDNGLGVPSAMRRAVFERFVRVEGDHRGKAGGHGLGLAQVDEIVRAHGGAVACEDGTDGGARFVVRLKATQDAPEESPEELPA